MLLNFSHIKKLLIVSLLSLFSFNCFAKDDITFANFRDIRDLNPHLYGGEMWAQNMLYESLVHYNQAHFLLGLPKAGLLQTKEKPIRLN